MIDMVKLLLSGGIKVNTQDPLGNSALFYTIKSDVANILISHGADVNITNLKGQTPIFGFYPIDQIDYIKLLVESGADINHQDLLGKTALHYGCYFNPEGELSDFRLFDGSAYVKLGADLNIQDNEGNTPAHIAAMCTKPMLSLLISKGCQTNIANKKGLTVADIIRKNRIDLTERETEE